AVRGDAGNRVEAGLREPEEPTPRRDRAGGAASVHVVEVDQPGHRAAHDQLPHLVGPLYGEPDVVVRPGRDALRDDAGDVLDGGAPRVDMADPRVTRLVTLEGEPDLVIRIDRQGARFQHQARYPEVLDGVRQQVVARRVDRVDRALVRGREGEPGVGDADDV